MTRVRRSVRIAAGAAAAAALGLTLLHQGATATTTTATTATPAAAHGDEAEALRERGAYLMNSIVACGNCHTPMGPQGPLPGMELAGGATDEEPGMIWRAANITPDAETGIGRWSDGQIATAIRDGIRPDGSLIGPPMPVTFYKKMADRDVAALIAYMRSVAPVQHAVARSEYQFPLPPSWGPPAATGIEAPSPADKVAYGAYLGEIGHCMHCHTPMQANGHEPDETMVGAGGMPLVGPWGSVVSANITSDRETGLGGWTDQQIKDAITKAVRPDGTRLGGPMGFGYYANMTPEDLDALVAWVRSLPPIHNKTR